MWRHDIRHLIWVPLVFVLLLIPAQIIGPPPAADAAFTGDYNCDGSVGSLDGLAALRIGANLQEMPSCADPVSVDCDNHTDAVDALLILRYTARLQVSLPAGCRDIGSLTLDTPPDVAATVLAQKITGGEDLATVVGAVNESLSYAGVSAGTEGNILLAARPPSTDIVVIPMESLNLALEARDRSSVYRTTADDLGLMLADFGWPFAGDSTPGEQFAAFIREWVTEAEKDKADIRNFVPLFLAEMAEHAGPPVDLKDAVAPELMTFSTLEVQLIIASFDRETMPPPAADAGAAVAPQAVTPCADAKKYISDNLGPFAGQLAGVGVSEGVSKGLEAGLSKAGVSSSTNAAFSQALSSVAIISRLWKLIAFYGDSQVNVTIDGDNPQHKKPESGPDNLLKLFKATAGVSEEDFKAYQEKFGELGLDVNSAVRDCLSAAGIPTLADLGEIANDAENWSVEWRIYADPKHAIWSPDQQVSAGAPLQGVWRAKLARSSDFSADTHFVVEVAGEDKAADHPGYEKDAPVRVCAEVDAAQPPSLGTFVNAAKGILGLVDAISELAGSWLQKVIKPTSCGDLTVTWHEANVCPGVVSSATSEGLAFSVSSATGTPPCAYAGTASATHTWNEEPRHITFVSTASGLRFEMKTVNAGVYGYELVDGTVTVEASGTFQDCTVSGGSTITFGQDDTGFKGLVGGITIKPDEGYQADGGSFDLGMQVGGGVGGLPLLLTCPGDGGPHPWQSYIVTFLRAPNPPGAFNWEPATDFQLLAGSRTDDPGYYGTFAPGVSTYQWSLHAELCPSQAQPAGPGVCQ